MKIHGWTFLALLLSAPLAAAACTVAADGSQADEEVAIDTATSALSICGEQFCGSGYHVSSYSCSSLCGPCNGTTNTVNCDLNSIAFQQCGTSCPSGWHATAYWCKSTCGPCTGSTPNAATCNIDN